jgi:quercetin dioxygenase-like cupin family protein
MRAPYGVASGGAVRDLWWKTGRVRVKTSSRETDGRLAQVEIEDPYASAPPFHVHHQEDETFYVLEGDVRVFAGEETIDASAGDFVFVPRGTVHAYLVRSERARMLVSFAPGGFEQFFADHGIPADDARPDGRVEPGPAQLGEIMAGYGCELVAPPPQRPVRGCPVAARWRHRRGRGRAYLKRTGTVTDLRPVPTVNSA